MKIRHPFLIRLSAFVLAWVMRLWVGTLRLRKIAVDGLPHPIHPSRRRFIFAVWHDSVISMASVRLPADVLISRHADGELIAQTCGFLNVGVVRGSTTRGGATAILRLASSKRPRHILITPDGPQGPRHRLQAGIVALASRTGLPIVLVAIGFARAWRLRSWDRTVLPFPWSLAHAIASEAIAIPSGLSREELDDYRSRIERRFLHLTELAQRWADSGRRPSASELAPPADLRLELPKCA